MKNAALKKWLTRVVLLLPLLLPLLIDNQYYIHGILCRIFIYAILVASLDLVVGYIGDISIGHAGLFAIGSYAVAILTAPPDMNAGATLAYMPQLPFFVALAIGVLLAAFAGLLLGFPALRSSGPYLAVTTIAYGMIIYTIINNQEALTNGTKGIHVHAIELAGIRFDGNKFLWIVYPALLLVMWIVSNLSRSFWGRSFEAIKYSSIAAESVGISRSYNKIAAFVISAGLAGFAGGLFTELDQYIAASTFTLDFSIIALIALIFGGLRSTYGNVLGMALVVILPDLFTWFQDYRLLVFGTLLLLTLFFLPNGMAGLFSDIYRKIFPRRDHNEEHRRALDAEASKITTPLFTKRATNSQVATLALEHVTMRFGGLTAVNDLELQIRPGSIHGLMGPNGSGKSTTVNMITGIYTPTSGKVQIFGGDMTKKKTYERARKGVARTFQNLQLFSDLTVLDNVLVGLHCSFKSSLWQVMIGLPSVWREDHELRLKAYRLLQFVGLEKSALEKARNLAYGQARRLEIARALALDPSLLLLDEPAAGLTSGEIEEFNEMIRKVKSQGISILLIEHHMDMLMAVSEDITVLDFGKKIAEGDPEKIQADPNVVRAYLGTEATPAGLAGGASHA